MKEQIVSWKETEEIGVIGPCDATIVKMNDKYRRVIYMKHKEGKHLLVIKKRIEAYIKENEQLDDFGVVFDFNPTHSY